MKKTSKRHELKEGNTYTVPLPDGSCTIAQLCNHHKVGEKESVNTFAFFNYKKEKIEDFSDNIDEIDLKTPFSVVTVNGYPWHYGWTYVSSLPVCLDKKILSKINKNGLMNSSSIDPLLFLRPYFGLFPWDGYYEDDCVDKDLLPNAPLRDDIKYLKDYTTEELMKIMPPNAVKLKKRLEEEGNMSNS